MIKNKKYYFWNPQHKHIPNMSLVLHIERNWMEISSFFTGSESGYQDSILFKFWETVEGSKAIDNLLFRKISL